MGDTPLHQRDTIEVPRTHQNLINMRYIARTGKVPIGGSSPERYNIEWKVKDAFTDAARAIEDRSQARIDKDADLQALLKKKTWDKADREKWEEDVSNIIKEETAATSGLANYRTILNPSTPQIKPLHRVNDLSADIANNTEQLRFDCGVESLLKGSIMQRIEDRNLPAGDTREHKTAAAYFFATSVMQQGIGADATMGGHAYLLAPTGNIIEETINAAAESDYKRTLYPNSLETFVRGNGVVTAGPTFYGISNGSKPFFFGWTNDVQEVKLGVDKVTEATQGVLENRREDGVLFTSEQLFGRRSMKGFQVAEDKKGDFIVCVSAVKKEGKDYYELKLYQKVNKDTPQEAFTLVGYAHEEKKPGTKNAGLSISYSDPMSGRTYHAEADVSKMTEASLKIYQMRPQPGARTPTFNYDYSLREKVKLSDPPAPLVSQAEPAVKASVLALVPVSPAFNATAAPDPQDNKPPQTRFGVVTPDLVTAATSVTPPDPKRPSGPATPK